LKTDRKKNAKINSPLSLNRRELLGATPALVAAPYLFTLSGCGSSSSNQPAYESRSDEPAYEYGSGQPAYEYRSGAYAEGSFIPSASTPTRIYFTFYSAEEFTDSTGFGEPISAGEDTYFRCRERTDDFEVKINGHTVTGIPKGIFVKGRRHEIELAWDGSNNIANNCEVVIDQIAYKGTCPNQAIINPLRFGTSAHDQYPFAGSIAATKISLHGDVYSEWDFASTNSLTIIDLQGNNNLAIIPGVNSKWGEMPAIIDIHRDKLVLYTTAHESFTTDFIFNTARGHEFGGTIVGDSSSGINEGKYIFSIKDDWAYLKVAGDHLELVYTETPPSTIPSKTSVSSQPGSYADGKPCTFRCGWSDRGGDNDAGSLWIQVDGFDYVFESSKKTEHSGSNHINWFGSISGANNAWQGHATRIWARKFEENQDWAELKPFSTLLWNLNGTLETSTKAHPIADLERTNITGDTGFFVPLPDNSWLRDVKTGAMTHGDSVASRNQSQVTFGYNLSAVSRKFASTAWPDGIRFSAIPGSRMYQMRDRILGNEIAYGQKTNAATTHIIHCAVNDLVLDVNTSFMPRNTVNELLCFMRECIDELLFCHADNILVFEMLPLAGAGSNKYDPTIQIEINEWNSRLPELIAEYDSRVNLIKQMNLLADPSSNPNALAMRDIYTKGDYLHPGNRGAWRQAAAVDSMIRDGLQITYLDTADKV
jgi:hypothetical protein